ncbi:thioredoxin family protein [Paenibacillus guangzhouensis]|uniref:thioredoxin family protein n=1 Tax=Paenibacillus guangzhouensis TaxID=1473112 RepID=UPI001266B923|nr:thioredoxin family protein [Paenibacillus guangzhouensis]
MSMKTLTQDNLNQILAPTGVTLVEFGAPWCPPCKVLLPLLDELDQEHGSDVSIIKINVDESPESSSHYQIMSLPTVMFFKDGVPQDRLVGLRPKTVYQEKIKQLLA